MTIPKLTTALLLGCAALASACTTDSSDDEVLAGELPPGSIGDPDGPVRGASTGIAETPDDVAVPPAGAPPLVTSGTYRLSSDLSGAPGPLLPATAGDAALALEALRDRPSKTLFALAAEAGEPAADALRAELSPELADRLDGWIDDHVRATSTDHGPLDHAIAEVLAICHAGVDAIHLDSRLIVGGGAAIHRLDAVELIVLREAFTFDVDPIAGGPMVARTVVAIGRDDGGTTLTLSGHTFALPYGPIAWRAADQLIVERFGRDLRGVLGAQLDCPGLAADVARQCVGDRCVEHERELAAVCEAGADRAADSLRKAFERAVVAPIQLDAGTARLADATPADGVADAIEDGRWLARVDLGQGPQAVDGRFTGARE